MVAYQPCMDSSTMNNTLLENSKWTILLQYHGCKPYPPTTMYSLPHGPQCIGPWWPIDYCSFKISKVQLQALLLNMEKLWFLLCVTIRQKFDVHFSKHQMITLINKHCKEDIQIHIRMKRKPNLIWFGKKNLYPLKEVYFNFV